MKKTAKFVAVMVMILLLYVMPAQADSAQTCEQATKVSVTNKCRTVVGVKIKLPGQVSTKVELVPFQKIKVKSEEPIDAKVKLSGACEKIKIKCKTDILPKTKCS